MKGLLLTALLAATTLAIPAHAQFGGIVLDPTQAAHAAQQLLQGSQLYTTTIKTTQNVMETYNLAQRMATAPSSYYTAFSNMAQQTWTPVAHPANTYGNSLPWTNAATNGNGAAAANQGVSIQRTGQISGYSSLSLQGQQAIAAQGATVDLGDAVNATSLQTIGTVRANAPQRLLTRMQTPSSARLLGANRRHSSRQASTNVSARLRPERTARTARNWTPSVTI